MLKQDNPLAKKWKILTIVFGVMSFGAASETLRIMTTAAPDISGNRGQLIQIGLVITTLFIFLTYRFWNKSKEIRRF